MNLLKNILTGAAVIFGAAIAASILTRRKSTVDYAQGYEREGLPHGTIGKLSDSPVTLENILRGLKNKWFIPQTKIMDGWGYVVELTGETISGKTFTDVYPITEDTYFALQERGI